MLLYELLERREGFAEKKDADAYLETHAFRVHEPGVPFIKFARAAELFRGVIQTDPPPANSMVWVYFMDHYMGLVEARVDTPSSGITNYWTHVYRVDDIPEQITAPVIPRSRALRIK